MSSLLRIVDLNGAVPKLDAENLEKVFGKIPSGAKVTILGVCGNLRQGKSFLLNVFKEALEDPSRLDEHAIVFKGIPFSDGTDLHTKGIRFWSEPLRIQKPSGEILFVVLMDTQGINGVQHSKKVSAQTVAIANLLSSFLIFNKNGLLESTDVEEMQLSMQYGQHLYAGVAQHLLFLLRDFNGSISGVNNHYINRMRAMSYGARDNATALHDIQQTFENFTCFTLTEPSMNVKMASGEVAARDCGKAFLDGLKNLVIFIRDNIQEKRLAGRAMSAVELKTHIEMIVTSVGNRDAPEFVTSSSAMGQTSLMEAEVEYKRLCQQHITALPPVGLDNLLFGRAVEETRVKLIERLESIPFFGRNETKEALKRDTMKEYEYQSLRLYNVNRETQWVVEEIGELQQPRSPTFDLPTVLSEAIVRPSPLPPNMKFSHPSTRVSSPLAQSVKATNATTLSFAGIDTTRSSTTLVNNHSMTSSDSPDSPHPSAQNYPSGQSVPRNPPSYGRFNNNGKRFGRFKLPPVC